MGNYIFIEGNYNYALPSIVSHGIAPKMNSLFGAGRRIPRRRCPSLAPHHGWMDGR